MPTNFRVTRTNSVDGELVEFGPLDQVEAKKLAIPASLTRVVSYPELSLVIELSCTFTGDRIEITKMVIESSGSFIATRDLTQLALPAVMRAIALESIPGSSYWTSPSNDSVTENRAFLAQLYWLEHVSWGSPRATIMTLTSWSRTNANWHIKKLAKEFELPGAHAIPASKSEVTMDVLVKSLK